MAQEYDCTVVSPYQTDATGEARFAKGILDAADAAFALESWEQEDNCLTFNCVKMRSASMKSFTSTMDWETLKIGPECRAYSQRTRCSFREKRRRHSRPLIKIFLDTPVIFMYNIS